MNKRISMADYLKLSVEERIQLVVDVWDSISNIPEAVQLTASQKKVLDQRMDEYQQDPSQGLPWSEVKKNILS